MLGRLGQCAFATPDEEEVAGYAEVMDIVFQSYAEIPLTENHIKQLHGALLRHAGKDAWHRGGYKSLSNNVEAFGPDGRSLGVVFETTTPFDTPFRMQELVAWTRQALDDRSLHPLLVTGVFVVVFLRIHPFQDGNGRLSRVLTTLLLLRSGYAYVPYSSLESVIEQNKEGYYLALRRTQGTLDAEHPDWLPWLRFFMASLHAQKKRLVAKLEGGERPAGLSPEALSILEEVDRRGRITTAEATALTGLPRPTAKNRLSELVIAGLVVRHGQGRGSWYARR